MADDAHESDGRLTGALTAFTSSLSAFAAQENPAPVVNLTVEPSGVTLQSAEAPVVNVTVPVPEVNVSVPAPEVNVTNDVRPAGVTVIDTPRTKTVLRDQFGNIAKIVEE
jgi:hypothetical protein